MVNVNRVIFLCFSVLLLGFFTTTIQANDFIDIEADEVIQNKELDIISAAGNVLIIKGTQQLSADKVIYHTNNKRLIATGNVHLKDEADKEIEYRGTYLEVTDDFKEILIEELEAIIAGSGKLWAKKFEHKNSSINRFTKAKYTTCDVCEQDRYLWEIHSDDVTHNTDKKIIEYRDVQMRFMDIPVFYTPYFRHPDPTVKRQSGITDFNFGSDPNAGSYIRPQYFQIIDDHSDIFFSPIFSQNYRVSPHVKYRNFLEQGEIHLEAAYLRDSDRRTAGKEHQFFGKLDVIKDINDEWRVGSNLERASSRSFFKDYPFFGTRENYIKSNIFAEGFLDQNYARYELARFYDLRDGDNFQKINISPHITIDGVGKPSKSGGRWRLFGDIRTVKNNLIAQQEALHLDTGYVQPFLTPFGSIFEVDAGVKVSRFKSKFSSLSNVSSQDVVTQNRILPEVNLAMWYPIRNLSEYGDTLIEPKISGYLSTSSSGNNEQTYNADTAQFELNTSNIFARNRLSGYSFIETKPRISYGVTVAHYFNNSRYVDFFIGQSRSFVEDRFLQNNFGIDNRSSDYLVDLRAKINENLHFSQYLVYDGGEGNINRLRMNLNYAYRFFTRWFHLYTI